MAGPVRISILADGSRARREFSQTARSGSTMGRLLGKAGKATALGLGVGLLAAAAGAKKFAEAAAQDEQAAGLLELALKKNAKATDAQVAATERWITAQGKALGVTDDELRPALSSLVTATKDVGKAQKLTSLAMDVSAAKGKSLESVSTALMKAENGQVSALARLGINTKNAKGETITMEQAVRRMADTFGGAAATKAGTLQGRLDRLKVMASEAGEELGGKLLDGIEKLTPTLEDLAGWVKDNRDEIEDFGTSVKDQALPVLKTLAELVKGAVTAVHSLPGPVKSAGAQVLLAAIALKGLNTAIAAVRTSALVTSLSTLSTGLRTAETRTKALGTAARGVAGAAGMLALTSGVGQSNEALSTLTKTAAGAAIGFSVGGPWGAAIGGAAGLVAGLSTSLGDSKDAARDAYVELSRTERIAAGKQAIDDYKASLDELTGAFTDNTRESVLNRLETSGYLVAAQKAGVSRRTAVNAVLGNAAALQQINRQMRQATTYEIEWTSANGARNYSVARGKQDLAKYRAALEASGATDIQATKSKEQATLAQQRFNQFLREEGINLREVQRQKRLDIAATQDLSGLYKKMPKRVATKIDAVGVVPTVKGIAKVARQFHLTPRQIRSVIDVVGVETSVRRVRNVAKGLKGVDGTKATLKAWLGGLQTAVDKGAKFSDRESKTVVTKLEAIEKARPDLSPYVASVREAVSNARGKASESTSVGAQLKSGLLSGMYGTGAALSAIMTSAVAGAIAAARRTAKIKSPSRATYEIGDLMGRGLIEGLAARQRGAKEGGRSLAASVLAGVVKGSSGVDKALEQITALVEKRIKGKGEDKRQRAVLRGLKDEFRQLKLNGKAQDRVTSALEKQRGRLRELVSASRQYAATIKEGFVDYGSVVGLGVREGSSAVSLSGLLSQLKARAAASERFSALIAQLTQARLNQTSLQQLLAAGVDGGLATAEAIASGGSAAITQINQLTQQIGQQGGALGNAMADKFHAAGIRAAQGVVDGLEKRQRLLDRAGQRMASALVKQLGKELGVKTGGPRGGLDWSQTHSRRTPALDAYRGRPVVEKSEVNVVNHFHITAPVGASSVDIGRTVVKHVDAYFKAGGTTKTIVKRGTTS